MTVMGYIQNTQKRFHTYVANRVTEILERTTADQWRHCPGVDNPADRASRSTNATHLVQNDTWWRGPAFLREPAERWPTTAAAEIAQDDPEVKMVTLAMMANAQEGLAAKLCARWSSHFRLCLHVAWLLRYIQFLKSKTTCPKGSITVPELAQAESRIVRLAQNEAFATEMTCLKEGKAVPASSTAHSLGVFLDDGLLRVGGRIQNARAKYDTRHPALLPKDHPLSRLILNSTHVKYLHAPVETTISAVRERYWIVGCRQMTRRMMRSCVTCRKQNSQPLKQVMAPLPEPRVTAYDPVFTRTGVDYFGPLEVALGRKSIKRWGCIFTCLATRACHLEVAPSLTTDDFFNTLKRFMSRRGPVQVIVSDNGTNFVGAEREIKQLLKENRCRISQHMREHSIEWRFNPPHASHQGGVWERMIRSVKRAIKSVAGARSLDDYRLITLFVEIEHMLNSRPLTANSDDPNDMEALTPNHFLMVRKNTASLMLPNPEAELNSRKRWHQVQHLANSFWRRWSKEYITALQARPKWAKTVRDVQVGDLVMLVEDNQPRACWQMGRIIEAVGGREGHVRRAVIKTATTTLTRPITKVCMLEESK